MQPIIFSSYTMMSMSPLTTCVQNKTDEIEKCGKVFRTCASRYDAVGLCAHVFSLTETMQQVDETRQLHCMGASDIRRS